MTSKVKAILERFRQDLEYKDLSTGELTELVGQLAHKHCVVNDSLCEMIVTEDDHKCLSVTINAHSSPIVHAFCSAFYSTISTLRRDGKEILETGRRNDEAQKQIGVRKLFEQLAVDYSVAYGVSYPLVKAADGPSNVAYIGLTKQGLKAPGSSILVGLLNAFLDDFLKDMKNANSPASGSPLPGQPGSKWNSRTGGPLNGGAAHSPREGTPRDQDPAPRPDQASALRREAEELSHGTPFSSQGLPGDAFKEAEERKGHEEAEGTSRPASE